LSGKVSVIVLTLVNTRNRGVSLFGLVESGEAIHSLATMSKFLTYTPTACKQITNTDYSKKNIREELLDTQL